jgi:hypothetical protein
MPLYVLSMIQPDGPIPPPEVLKKIMQDIGVIRDAMKASGAWVFSGGLQAPSTATVVRFREGAVTMTDGPFAEAKEHIGGFTIVDTRDLDAALGWAEKIARATSLPIEVRAFQDRSGR